MSEPFKERAEFFIRNEDFKQGYGFLTKKKKLWEVGKEFFSGFRVSELKNKQNKQVEEPG